MNIENVAWLIENGGNITIGDIGAVQCAAAACDEDNQLALLVKRDDESLLELLQRLDQAIAAAWDEEIFIDEVNI